MKTLEQLADEFQITNLDNLLPKIILDAVETVARGKRFGRSLVRVNRDLVNSPGRSINVPCHGSITAQHIGEGCAAAPDIKKFTYEKQEITPIKSVIGVKITTEAIEATQMDLIKEHILEAGEAMADLEDGDIISALVSRSGWNAGTLVYDAFALAPADGGAETTVSIAKLCLLYLTELKDGGANDLTVTKIEVDPADATKTKITFTPASAGGGNYSIKGYNSIARKWACAAADMQCCVIAATFGSLAYVDVLDASILVQGRNWRPNVLLIHPEQTAAMLKDTRFTDASQYGSNTPIMTGEIGKFAGLKVLVSTLMIRGVALVMDTSKAAYLVMKRDLDLKRWDNPASDCTELYFWYEYGVGVIRPEAICLVIGAGTFQH